MARFIMIGRKRKENRHRGIIVMIDADSIRCINDWLVIFSFLSSS